MSLWAMASSMTTCSWNGMAKATTCGAADRGFDQYGATQKVHASVRLAVFHPFEKVRQKVACLFYFPGIKTLVSGNLERVAVAE